VFAKDSAGLTTAQAAPALKSWANLRREIEMLFILKPPSGGDTAISGELRDGKLRFLEAAVTAPILRVPQVFFGDNRRRSLLARRNLGESGRSRLSSRRRRHRHHLMRRSLWLGRVCRSEGRRIYDYRCWLFFLSGLDCGGKRGIEHRQSNGFGEN